MSDMEIITELIDKYADKSYEMGYTEGRKEAYSTVLWAWQEEMECDCEEAMQHLQKRIEEYKNE